MIECFSLEIDFGYEIKAIEPDPLRAIVIAEAMGNFGITGLIGIIVVGAIVRMIVCQGSHSNRFLKEQVRFYLRKIATRMVLLEDFRSEGHGNEGVGPEPMLVIIER